VLEVHAQQAIRCPAAVAFEFIADMANNPRWQKGMQSCVWTSEPPLRLGSTYDQTAKFLGKQIVSSFEVVEFVAGEHIRIKTTSGSMPIDVTRSVDPVTDNVCLVEATVRGDASGLFRVATPIMKLLVSRSVNADYKRLKKLLEAE
jgi:hypothetical protein